MRTTNSHMGSWRSPAPSTRSPSRSTSETPTTEMTDETPVDRLARLVAERRSDSEPNRPSGSSHGHITSLAHLDAVHLSTLSYTQTSLQIDLRRNCTVPLPDMAVAKEGSGGQGGMVIAAVGETVPATDVFDESSTWKICAARTITSLLSAHEHCGAYLAWMTLGSRSARLVLIDGKTIALEHDTAFLASTPRIVSIADFFDKDCTPILPTSEVQLVDFLSAALDLFAPSRGLWPFPTLVSSGLLSSPQPPTSIPQPSPSGALGRRLRRSPVHSPGSPSRSAPSRTVPSRKTPSPPRMAYSPPRMAIADLSTPPSSTSPLKRFSPGQETSPKRPAIDVYAWRTGVGGAALFESCEPERCCSPTELDTSPPSEGGGTEIDPEDTLRPGMLHLAAETARPGLLTLQPAWEGVGTSSRPLVATETIRPLGPTTTMRPLGPAATLRPPVKPSAETEKPVAQLGNYLAVLAAREVRLVLVSSTQMDDALEGLRRCHA